MNLDDKYYTHILYIAHQWLLFEMTIPTTKTQSHEVPFAWCTIHGSQSAGGRNGIETLQSLYLQSGGILCNGFWLYHLGDARVWGRHKLTPWPAWLQTPIKHSQAELFFAWFHSGQHDFLARWGGVLSGARCSFLLFLFCGVLFHSRAQASNKYPLCLHHPASHYVQVFAVISLQHISVGSSQEHIAGSIRSASMFFCISRSDLDLKQTL